jgi:hypothetical protein
VTTEFAGFIVDIAIDVNTPYVNAVGGEYISIGISSSRRIAICVVNIPVGVNPPTLVAGVIEYIVFNPTGGYTRIFVWAHRIGVESSRSITVKRLSASGTN